MIRKLPKTSFLYSFVLCVGACEVEDGTLPADLGADDLEFRDLLTEFRNTPVLIQNLDNLTCLGFDPSLDTSPLELECDAKDSRQRFEFEVQTYVGGIGFVYNVCLANSALCLRHHDDGTAVFVDEEQLASLEGTWFDQVRIQHDEDQAFIEFRDSGKCVTPGTPITVQSCDWFASDQHYRLVRPPSCDVVDHECYFDEKCVPYSVSGGSAWNASQCVPYAVAGGQPGDPCVVGEPGGVDTCDETSVCYYASPDDEEGVCAEFCDPTTAPCSSPLQTCVSPDGGFYRVCL